MTEPKIYNVNKKYLDRLNSQIKAAERLVDVKKNLLKIAEEKDIPLDCYYMSKLLNSISKKERSSEGLEFFDHFQQSIKSFRYIQSLKKPKVSDLKDKFVDLPDHLASEGNIIFIRYFVDISRFKPQLFQFLTQNRYKREKNHHHF